MLIPAADNNPMGNPPCGLLSRDRIGLVSWDCVELTFRKGALPADPGTTLFIIRLDKGEWKLYGAFVPDASDGNAFPSFEEAAKAASSHLEAWLDALPSRLEGGSGARRITIERLRQIYEEGFDAQHDLRHLPGTFVNAAGAYAMAAACQLLRRPGSPLPSTIPHMWPWEASWWKPSPDPSRNLVKAGALIAAEIDHIESTRAACARGAALFDAALNLKPGGQAG